MFKIFVVYISQYDIFQRRFSYDTLYLRPLYFYNILIKNRILKNFRGGGGARARCAPSKSALAAGIKLSDSLHGRPISWTANLSCSSKDFVDKCRNPGGATFPDSKVHGANMGPIWGRQDPGGPHVGPMNFVIWVFLEKSSAILNDVIKSPSGSKYHQNEKKTWQKYVV